VCERCGALQEVDDTLTGPFATQLVKRFGFKANFTHFAVLGECRSCAKRSTRAPRRKAAASARARR
jgi:Fe2+ or Zn2+ uptake regulation protein